MNIFIALFSLVILIALHEFGHFILAKKFGVKVEEFAIFFPPRLLAKKIGETVYSLNLIPLGAFVKMKGEEEQIDEPDSFGTQPYWQKALIVLGGVMSFWIIGAILLSVNAYIGTNQVITDTEIGAVKDPKVQIVQVASESPADKAGIKMGDIISELRNEEIVEINKVSDVQDFTKDHTGEEVEILITRGEEEKVLRLTPRENPPAEEGAMGIALARTGIVKYPLWKAPIEGAIMTKNLTIGVIAGWYQLGRAWITGEDIGAQVMGPVGVTSMMADFVDLGWNYYLRMLALISIYLAIFNLLPIPALDGGKLMFLTIEKVRGKPIDEKIERAITGFFFLLLIGLILFITFKDIIRLF